MKKQPLSIATKQLIFPTRCSADRWSSRRQRSRRQREIGPMRSLNRCMAIIWRGLSIHRQGSGEGQRRPILRMVEADREEGRPASVIMQWRRTTMLENLRNLSQKKTQRQSIPKEKSLRLLQLPLETESYFINMTFQIIAKWRSSR